MMLRNLLIVALLLLAASTQLGGGCVSDSGGDNGNIPPNYDDIGRPNRIPRNADLVREGTDKIKWTADLNGEFYVYDVAKDRIVYTGPVKRGQEIVVQPKSDRIYVAGAEVYNQNVRKDAVHRIYFARERSSSGGGSNNDDITGAVPSGATRLAHGKGDIAIKEAPHDGTVYVYDNSARKVVYTRAIKRGNSFQIFPDKNYVNQNSKKVAEVRLDNKAEFTLYFKRD